ncbi:hypothetical protein IEN85_01120 [Pelagicoccus sp. NFK12]|jgi:hypothetical protein|uniref:Uncharacterized protein n=1 Tax=Pelagicoccus enzymogenes TaxID=2773457 RepID=A0A927IG77_9BACT|nr:hypothetical protein [Pelagicoccus enzymogenes]MBD5778095.1 hypothetical protein [Pelagicoccus enzymogenes]MDQ8198149.1 hypothetical protein [Pelagicoccus enzymogenes]
MFVEIFTICDAATDYGGRLNILGAFEGIAALSAPVKRDRCSLAVRMRFDAAETGEHAIEIRFEDHEGQVVGPTMSAKVDVKIHAGRTSGAHNLVLNINGMRFPHFGTYDIRLLVDGEVRSSIPLLVAQTQKRNRMRGSMEN